MFDTVEVTLDSAPMRNLGRKGVLVLPIPGESIPMGESQVVWEEQKKYGDSSTNLSPFIPQET